MTALPCRAETENKTSALHQSQAELKHISQTIQALQKKLARLAREMDAQQKQLRESELAISRRTREIQRLSRQISESRNHLQELEAAAAAQEEKVTRLKHSVQTLLFTLYRRSAKPSLAIILDSSDPHEFKRLMAYSNLLSAAQQATIHQWLAELTRYDEQIQAVEAQKSHLTALKARTEKEKEQLRQAIARRKSALDTLRANEQKEKSRLASLEKDRNRLNQVIQEITRAIAEVERLNRERSRAFQKSTLPWPVKGKLIHRFGERIHNSSLRSNGVFIQTDEKAPVSAVQSGRVVFADWLRGYGLVIILDHGNHYLTLYGQNQSLLHETGDWVRKGEVIALAGNTGGGERSGLYFEVRKKGVPLDPENWLKRQ